MHWLDKIRKGIRQIDNIGVCSDSTPETIIKAPDVPPSDIGEPPEPVESYFDRVIMPLARAEEEKVLAAQEETLTRFEKDHRAQFEGYKLDCRRHGDFLTLFMTRAANINYPYPGEDNYTATINLNKVTRIVRKDGHGPDKNGITGYRVSLVSETNAGVSVVTFFSEREFASSPKPPYYHTVEAIPTAEPHARSFVHDKRGVGDFYMESYSYNGRAVNLFTPGTARLSEDDQIIFEGLKMIVYCPYGKGAEVEAKILEAIGQGFKPKNTASEIR